MPGWAQVARTVPGLASDALASLDVGNHKTLATLRADGSPRISGTEARVVDGELWIGSMWMTPKARDLRRDPRYALHSWSAEPEVWMGDAKVAGRAEEVDDDAARARLVEAAGTAPPGRFHLFRLDVDEIVVLRLGETQDHIVARRWTPGSGERTTILR